MLQGYIDIKGYEGVYLINKNGSIISLARREPKIVKTTFTKFGYEKITLHKNCERKTCLIHRLVAINFLKPVPGKLHVNHKDGNKKNNCMDNLEWVTILENNIHAYETGLKIMPKWDDERRGKYQKHIRENGPMSSSPVIDPVTGKKYSCIKEAANDLGINYQTLYSWVVQKRGSQKIKLIIAEDNAA